MTASNSENLTSIAVGASVGDSAGIVGSFSVNLVTNTTRAGFGDGSTMRGGAERSAIRASDSTSLDSIAGGIAGGGDAGIGAGVSVGIIKKSTTSGFGAGDTVDYTGSLSVLANSQETINALAVNAGLGGSAAVTGSADVYLVNTDTEAYLGDGSTVQGTGFIAFGASDSSTINLLAGGAAVGGSAGVAASNTTLLRNDTTLASVGNGATLDVGDLFVSAYSGQTISTLAAGGGAAGDVGVAGSATVNVLNQDTRAWTGFGVQVNASGNVGVSAQADTT